MRARALSSMLLVAAVVACAEPASSPPTGLLLRIDAEASTKAQLASVRVVLHRDAGSGWEERGDDTIPKERISTWPIEIPVRRLDGADPSLELQVHALDADSRALNVARLVTRFVPDAIGVVPVLLRDGCLDEACATLEACHGPECLGCRIDVCEPSGQWQPVSYVPGEDLGAQLDRFMQHAGPGGDAGGAVDGSDEPRAPCTEDQRVVSGVCAPCPDGTSSAAGADPSGADTSCQARRCAIDQRVLNHTCTPCAEGTKRAAGDDASGADTGCEPIVCEEDQHVVAHACEACESGEMNRAGDEASGADTTCDGNLCASNQHVVDGTCQDCADGTAREAGDDPTGEDTLCAARECEADQRVLDHACVDCAPGTIAPAGASAAGEDTACTPRLCETDQHVVAHACAECPEDGLGNRAGDDASGDDTTCDGALCATNQRVAAGECVACEAGSTNEAGDNAFGQDTSCEPILCVANERVASHACVSCPLGSTNAAGDSATGGDTSCEPTLCGVNQHVVSHACVGCSGSAMNEAGDDATGDDTSCDTCCPDGNCLCHGDAPAELTSDEGPYGVSMYEIPGVGCVWHPTDAELPLAALTLAEGFTGDGGCTAPQISGWPTLYASWGIVAMVVNTVSDSQPETRANALEDGIEALRDENLDSASPLFDQLSGRYATSGFSMGGAAANIASSRDDTLRAGVALMPTQPDCEGIEVPTLIVCGSSDSSTFGHCDVFGGVCYDDIASSVPKLIVTISSGHLGSASAGGGASGEYGLAFMKLFLEGDERWRAPLLAAPNDNTTLE